ncbi:unnamed protein product [Caenorhabditis auriculariae]|uniref:Uncharacterized protein n=1 Tax=Caenorhabditis auriculariae TaxID=2777116 RepID=A0A8S1HUE0_9PELO|nr:unnamed protein product [Caenorhabditis auriculariae]
MPVAGTSISPRRNQRSRTPAIIIDEEEEPEVPQSSGTCRGQGRRKVQICDAQDISVAGPSVSPRRTRKSNTPITDEEEKKPDISTKGQGRKKCKDASHYTTLPTGVEGFYASHIPSCFAALIQRANFEAS